VPNVNLLSLSFLTGEEDALSHLTKYHSAFGEADGRGWIPLHKAAVQLNKNILEITLKGKLTFTLLDASEK
jgi:ankyrin repeat/SOCS box protein 14